MRRRWSTAWLGVRPCPGQRPRTAQARPEGRHPPREPVRASFSAQASAPRRAAQPGTNPRPLDCSSPASAYTPLNRVRPTTDSTATGQRRRHRTLGPCPSTHQPRVRSRPGNGSRPRFGRACACPSAQDGRKFRSAASRAGHVPRLLLGSSREWWPQRRAEGFRFPSSYTYLNKSVLPLKTDGCFHNSPRFLLVYSSFIRKTLRGFVILIGLGEKRPLKPRT